MTHETLAVIVWVVFFGVLFGSFYAYYQRRLLGDILRALISHEAQDEASAKTLAQIGYGSKLKHSFASFALRKNSGLRKHVFAVYEEKEAEKKHPDQLFVKPEAAEQEQKYYVPEEKRIVAEVRYDGKGTDLKTLVISVAALLAAAIIIVSFLPWLIDKYHSLMGSGEEKEEITEDYEYIEDTRPDVPEEQEKSGSDDKMTEEVILPEDEEK